MRVNPNSDIPGSIRPGPVKHKGKPQNPQDIDLTGSAGLARALENVPVVRADKVARAKSLVADPAYPNEATLSRVAGVLADHLEPPERPE